MKRKGFVIVGGLVVVLILVASLALSACATTPKEVEWRMYFDEAEGSPEWNYAENANELIFERTNGEVHITMYPEEALGYEMAQIVDVVGGGLLEISVLRCAHASGQAPMVNLGDLPFLQDTAEDAETVTDTVAPYYDAALEPFGVHVASMWKSAPTGLTCKVNVNTLEAWQGVKIRSWSPTLQDLSTLLGASPVQMPFSEAFSALQTGIIDGVYWTPSSALSVKTFDAGCKYYNQWNIFTMTNAIVVSDSALSQLSSNSQKVVMDTYKELEPWIYENEYWTFEQDYVDLRANGVEVVFVDPAEIAKVRAQTSIVWDSWLDKSGAEGLEALNTTLAALGRPAYR